MREVNPTTSKYILAQAEMARAFVESPSWKYLKISTNPANTVPRGTAKRKTNRRNK